MAAEPWKEWLRSVQVEPGFTPVPRPTEVDLQRWEQGAGLLLPCSYREFLLRFGPGELGDEYQIAAPAYPGANEEGTLEALNRSFREYTSLARRSEESLAEEFGDAARARRFVLFASTFGGDRYGWDPEDVRDADAPEFGIYLLPHPGPVEETAASFAEFVTSQGMRRFVPEPDQRLLQPETPPEEGERYDPEAPEYQEILAFARAGAFAETEFPDEQSFVLYVLETQEWNPEDEWVVRFEAWREAREQETE